MCVYVPDHEKEALKTRSNIQSLPSGHDEGSLQCSTEPALSLHVEQESVLCTEHRWLVHSSHVTADCSPLCEETVIEASIWYRSDVAFTTAFQQCRGTQTTPASAIRHQRALLCQAVHCFIIPKESLSAWALTEKQCNLCCNTKLPLFHQKGRARLQNAALYLLTGPYF